jgi:uncharacterized protein (TIGR03089 family)
MASSQPPGAVAGEWLHARSAAPLITYYGADGSRVELSGATASNAVAKAVNLFSDELLLDPGETVWIDLPCHWQVPVLALAAWASGLVVAVGAEPPSQAAATLATGEHPDRLVGVPLAVSLHPFGLPLGAAAPTGWEDYAAAARVQPDTAALRWAGADDAWLVADGEVLNGTDVLARAEVLADRWRLPQGGALLSSLPPAAAPGLLASTFVPAVRGGSALLTDMADTTTITRQEGNQAVARRV